VAEDAYVTYKLLRNKRIEEISHSVGQQTNKISNDQKRYLLPAQDFNCSVFGLHLRSNVTLPGLTPIQANPNSPDMEFHLGISPYAQQELSTDEEDLADVSPFTTETGEPVRRVWRVANGAFLRIAYFDGTQFWLDRKRENLWATWPASSSLEETLTYLLGPMLGILLRLRGVICLHASAVALGDYSVAFVGWAGAGKSTTAAAFARQGGGILSDDIVALEEKEAGFHVLPAYPHLCLWPDSVNMLYGSPEALPRFIPDWEKRRLALGEGGPRFESRSLPLAAIYLLSDRRPDAAPFVDAIRPQAALMSLVANTYANTILGRESRGHEFAVLGRLVSTVPVRRVYPHVDATRLGELCKVIQADLAVLEFPTTSAPRE
jgi:hypothetical protein